MLADQTTTLSPTGFETLDVGGWQVVVTDGHAVLPEVMTHLPDGAFQGRTSLVSVACPSEQPRLHRRGPFDCGEHEGSHSRPAARGGGREYRPSAKTEQKESWKPPTNN